MLVRFILKLKMNRLKSRGEFFSERFSDRFCDCAHTPHYAAFFGDWEEALRAAADAVAKISLKLSHLSQNFLNQERCRFKLRE